MRCNVIYLAKILTNSSKLSWTVLFVYKFIMIFSRQLSSKKILHWLAEKWKSGLTHVYLILTSCDFYIINANFTKLQMNCYGLIINMFFLFLAKFRFCYYVSNKFLHDDCQLCVQLCVCKVTLSSQNVYCRAARNVNQ